MQDTTSNSILEFVGGLNCSMLEYEPWAVLAPGQKVTVKGSCAAVGTGLFDCVIQKKGKNTATALTAEALTKEFGKAPEAADQKYAYKHLLVSGIVASAKSLPEGGVTVVLKGDGGRTVRLSTPAFEKMIPEDLPRPGARCRVLASYSPGAHTGTELHLSFPRFRQSRENNSSAESPLSGNLYNGLLSPRRPICGTDRSNVRVLHNDSQSIPRCPSPPVHGGNG